MLASLRGKELFVQDCFAGADPEFRLPIRVVTERAWHSLFARTMFLPSPAGETDPGHSPGFTVIDAPSVEADPAEHGTNSPVFVLLNFAERLVLGRRDQLCRRDQEIDLHGHELPAAAA